MDKNTFYGLLLMAIIVFGFMWLQKPSPEQIAEQQRRQQEMEQAQKAGDTEPSDVLTIDSVSPAEAEAMRATIRQYGTAGADSAVTLRMGAIDLSVAPGGALSGTVTAADGTPVSLGAILSHDYGTLKPATCRSAVAALRQGLADVARYQGFARYLHGDSTVVTLRSKALALDISTKGGQIARATLLDPKYTSYDSAQVELLSPDYGGYSFTLTTATQRFDTHEFYFQPREVSDTAVTMALDLGDGAVWALRYELTGDYTVRMRVVQQGMQKVIPPSVASMDFQWSQRMPRNEAGRVFEERNSGLYYQYPSGDVKHLSESSDDDKDVNERVRWIGFKNQFFSSVLVADKPFTGAMLDSRVLKADDAVKQLDAQATLEYSSLLAEPASFTWFLGPNLYPLLSDLSDTIVPEADLSLTKLIPLGWSLFRWINTLIVIPVFTFLGKFISNYGIICSTTILSKTVRTSHELFHRTGIRIFLTINFSHLK